MIHAATFVLVVMQLGWACGCNSVASQLGAAATPAIVHSGLHEVNTPDDQQQMQRLVDSPAFQHSVEKTSKAVTVGIFNEATDPQFRAGAQAMSEAIGEGFVSGMIKVLNDKGPELGDIIRKQLGPIVQELIREQIAPAVRDMVQQQLAPAALQIWKDGATETLKLTVRPDLQPDVQLNAQNASIGAGHGTTQMLTDSGWLAPSGDLAPRVKFFVWSAAGAAGLILLAMFNLLVMLNLLALHRWRQRKR